MSGFKNIAMRMLDPLGLVLKPEQAVTTPPPAPATPTIENPEVAEAMKAEAVRNRKLRGRGASLLYGAAAPDPTTRQTGASLLGQ